MTHLQQGWQFWVDFEGFEPDDRLLPFGSCNLCANGERYISQSQKPQIAQAATMFLQGKRGEASWNRLGQPEQEWPDPRPGQGGGSTECWVTLPIGASVDVENCQVC